MDEGAVQTSVSGASASVACASSSRGGCRSSSRSRGGRFVIAVPSVASILEGGGPFRTRKGWTYVVVGIIVHVLSLWLLVLIMVGVGHLIMDAIALVVLVLISVLVMLSVVDMLRLVVLVMQRSSLALSKGRAPSRVGIAHLLIEVGVVARAGRAGLLDGGTWIDAITSSVTSPPSPSA